MVDFGYRPSCAVETEKRCGRICWVNKLRVSGPGWSRIRSGCWSLMFGSVWWMIPMCGRRCCSTKWGAWVTNRSTRRSFARYETGVCVRRVGRVRAPGARPR